jgi:hypothetical protein
MQPQIVLLKLEDKMSKCRCVWPEGPLACKVTLYFLEIQSHKKHIPTWPEKCMIVLGRAHPVKKLLLLFFLLFCTHAAPMSKHNHNIGHKLLDIYIYSWSYIAGPLQRKKYWVLTITFLRKKPIIAYHVSSLRHMEPAAG